MNDLYLSQDIFFSSAQAVTVLIPVCGAAVSDLRNFMFIIFSPYFIAGKPLFFLLLQIVITESNIPMTAVFIRYIFPFKIR